MKETAQPGPPVDPSPLDDKLEQALQRLERARPFAKVGLAGAVIDLSRRRLAQPGGVEHLYALATRLDQSGVFAGTDWAEPATLLPSLVRNTLHLGQPASVVLECLSELRLLAIARGDAVHAGLSAEQARHFLTQVLALNLDRALGVADEAERARSAGGQHVPVREVLQFLLAHIGFDDILGASIDEVWRILAQRPIQVDHVKAMVRQIAATLSQGAELAGDGRLGADRLVSALFGPTEGSRDDPTADAYRKRLRVMDRATLRHEAQGFARAMHDTGLVSAHHVTFVRRLLDKGKTELLPNALGLSSTGLDALHCYSELTQRLITDAVWPQTAQALYGLALLLDRGTLYNPAVAPGLWRQINLQLSESTDLLLTSAFGAELPPRVFLLAALIAVLGQPLGIGQGNNPTCQAARALSMWSHSTPGYLIDLVARAARNDGIVMYFEGKALDSASLPSGLAQSVPLDADAVSMVLVPHLDRIYVEMGRLCAHRGQDPHRYINPEFHGFWVGREFFIAVDVASGKLQDHGAFLRRFYESYHPYYNGNQPIVHPQPAGIAVTDSGGSFVGWHAVTLMRVALDHEGTMRVYFYNPNNDGGQNWGHGVVVATRGHGERFGESSLPFAQLASRLYIFHDDGMHEPGERPVPASELETVARMAHESWAQDRLPTDPSETMEQT